MEFLKKIFNDDSTVIGLCGFGGAKQRGNKSLMKQDFLFNDFQTEKVFLTNFEQNVLLF